MFKLFVTFGVDSGTGFLRVVHKGEALCLWMVSVNPRADLGAPATLVSSGVSLGNVRSRAVTSSHLTMARCCGMCL